MMLWETYLLAQRTIRRNVLRSALTILGIVIGVAAVITMVTLGSGATAKVTGDISKLGSNMLQIHPGQGMRGPGGARSDSDAFTIADVRAISVSVAEGVSTESAKTDIERLMRERRKINVNQADDFQVRDMKELIDTLTGTTTVLTALLSAVAGVSLLVGGIGIMNIMMVSVTERTREIGTRLAIGALEREVLMQFLVESVVLATFGGLIGIAMGLCAAGIGARLIGVPFVFKPGIVAPTTIS